MPTPTWGAAPILSTIRGDDQVLEFYIVDADGEDMDLTGYSIRFTAAGVLPTTMWNSLTSEEGGGIVISEETTGLVTVTLSHDLDIMKNTGKYKCDLEITSGDEGTVSTVALFYLNVIDDVSR